MSSTTVESASFGILVTQGIVSSEFPVNITAGCGIPTVFVSRSFMAIRLPLFFEVVSILLRWDPVLHVRGS